jgi:6-phospho-3-hexuloisomerase
MSHFHQLRERALDEIKRLLSVIEEQDAVTLADEITNASRIFVLGVGRSGLAIQGYAMRLMHLGFSVHVVGDVTTPSIHSDDLLIAASGSGTTRGILQITESARNAGARLACITTVRDSPLARTADCCIVLPASTPKAPVNQDTTMVRSTQPLASLFEQGISVFCDIHIAMLMERLGESGGSMMARHANLE